MTQDVWKSRIGRRTTFLPGALLCGLGLAAADSFASEPLWTSLRPSGEEPYPIVRLSLADPLLQVVEQSSYPLEPRGDDDPLAVTEPAVFEYTHPARGFVLPPTRFIWLDVSSRRVEGVNLSPQLDYLSLEDTFSLAKRLVALFDGSGWERLERDDPSLEERRREFLDPETRDRHEVMIHSWQNGGERIYFNVGRRTRAEASSSSLQLSGREEDAYLITVYIDHLYDLELARIEEFGLYQRLATELETQAAERTATGYIHNVIDMELVEVTDEVPAKLGTSFGVRVLLLGAPEGRSVPVRVKVIHPPTRHPVTGRVSDEEEWRAMFELGETRYSGWRFDHDWELVPGEWTIQIHHDKEVVAQKKFVVHDSR